MRKFFGWAGAVALCMTAATAMGQLATVVTNSDNTAIPCISPAGTTTLDPGITSLGFCRSSNVNSGTAGYGFSSSGWTGTSGTPGDEATAVTNGDYVSLTLTAPVGKKITVTSIVARMQRSSTGPTNFAVRSSADSFATTVATYTVAGTTAVSTTITFATPVTNCNSLELRFYGWGASATTGGMSGGTGTYRLMQGLTTPVGSEGTQAMTINGSVVDDNTCLPTGSCCFNAATNCLVLSQADCMSQGGSNWQSGVSCQDAMCPAGVGACCVNGVCVGTLTQAACGNLVGTTWGGFGTQCDGSAGTPFECPTPTGSCCLPNDPVCTIKTAAQCSGGTWTINGFCNVSTCPQTGACCVGTNCDVRTYADCASMMGTWLGRNAPCDAGVCVRPALAANEVAKQDFDLQNDATSFVIRRVSDPMFTLPAWIPGQMFGIGQRFRAAPENLPFGVLDDSLTILTGDTQGIVSENKIDSWFGATNMYLELAGDLTPDDATQNGDDEVEAIWTFNVSGRSSLSLSIDMAAMGDFEAIDCSTAPTCVVDRYTFATSIDGGAFTDLFTIRADQAQTLIYTMASGTMTATIDDPMVLNGSTVLNNHFAGFSAAIPGTGSVLTLRLRAQSDGNTEGFAFDNITVIGDAVAACPGNHDGNGQVDADDLFAFLDDWFAQNGTSGMGLSADYDGNDMVDADDLFTYLDIWFANNGNICP